MTRYIDTDEVVCDTSYYNPIKYPESLPNYAQIADMKAYYKNLVNQYYGVTAAYFSTKENEMNRELINYRRALTNYLVHGEDPKSKEPVRTNARQIHIGVIDEDYYVDHKEVLYLSDMYGKEFPDLVDRVIINEPATIIIWKDGTKTIVKCTKNDIFDPEKGIAMCIVKKLFMDSSTRMNKFMDKWIPEDIRHDSRPFGELVAEVLWGRKTEDAD